MPARRGSPGYALTLALVLSGGCVAPSDESHDALAERYAREESRLIDGQAFEQARERSRVRSRLRERASIAAAAPLDVDLAVTDRWQFGTLRHPLHGEPVCAAVSGTGEPGPGSIRDAPRLVVLGDAAFVTSARPLVADRVDAAVRIDGGLPIPLEIASNGRIARLAFAHETLLARLRDGVVATLDVTLAPDVDPLAAGAPPRDASPSGAPRGDAAVTERSVGLDGLDVLLDELERCDGPGGEG